MKTRLRPDLHRIRRAAGKLVRSGPSGWWLLVQAERQLIAAATMVRRHPRGELIQVLEQGYSTGRAHAVDFRAAEEIAVAIDRAARFGPVHPLCLVRSIALHRLLEHRRIHGSRINVGVRMSGSTFAAHAWVELEGRVIGDDPTFVGQFSPLTGDGGAIELLTATRAVSP